MDIVTKPASRFGWPGERVSYEVHARAARELKIGEPDAPGLVARLKDVRDSGEKIAGRIVVEVGNASFA